MKAVDEGASRSGGNVESRPAVALESFVILACTIVSRAREETLRTTSEVLTRSWGRCDPASLHAPFGVKSQA